MVRDFIIDVVNGFIPKRMNRKKNTGIVVSEPQHSPTLLMMIQKSCTWQSRLDAGDTMEMIAQEKGMKVKRVSELLWLAKLPAKIVRKIEHGDDEVADWGLDKAIGEARRLEKLRELKGAFRKVERWKGMMARGWSRARIAKHEGISRARVTQLMKLENVPDEMRMDILQGNWTKPVPSIRELLNIQ